MINSRTPKYNWFFFDIIDEIALFTQEISNGQFLKGINFSVHVRFTVTICISKLWPRVSESGN